MFMRRRLQVMSGMELTENWTLLKNKIAVYNIDVIAMHMSKCKQSYLIGCDWKCRTSVLPCNFGTSVESFSKWMKLLFRLINVVYFH